MASALLAVLYPERLTVYDYRACEQLGIKDFADRKDVVERYFNEFLPKVAAMLGQADVCEAAATFRQATMELDRADREMAAAVLARQAELPPDPPDAGDATESAIAYARFRLDQKLLSEDTTAARAARDIFDAICGSVIGPLSERGHVVATDDFARVVQLETGASFALSNKAHEVPPLTGLLLGAEGIRFNDGTAVATDLVGTIPQGSGISLPCMELRIAPSRQGAHL